MESDGYLTRNDSTGACNDTRVESGNTPACLPPTTAGLILDLTPFTKGELLLLDGVSHGQ